MTPQKGWPQGGAAGRGWNLKVKRWPVKVAAAVLAGIARITVVTPRLCEQLLCKQILA